MYHDHHPEVFLETLRLQLLGGEWPSNTGLETLLRLCTHPAEGLRETSLSLLLQPPVADEMAYNRYLLRFLMRNGRQIKHFPGPVLELFCEVVAMSAKVLVDPEMGSFFIRVLKNLPKVFVRRLYDRTFPLEPFVHYIPLKSFLISPRIPALALKRRWRLLKKRLQRAPAASSWAQLTFLDLGRLLKATGTRRQPAIASGRWLFSGRPLVFPEDTTLTPPAGVPLERLFWRGSGTTTLRYFDHLLSSQAEELRSVRELAQTISQNTRRVVLSWHNATLAASSGWAFEDLCASFPSKSLWTRYKKSVRERIKKKDPSRYRQPGTAEYLWELRKDRVVIPKVLCLLWEEKMSAVLDSSHRVQLDERLEAVGKTLKRSDLESMLFEKGYGWAGVVGPHQRFRLPEISGWSNNDRRVWSKGLHRLAALIQEGQILLDKGLLSHLVLPWIDKFFISSRRQEDWEYLVTLVQWLERQGLKPLILFWEDTPHAREPSLKLTLRDLCELGHPFRGIGMFDWEGSQRSEALQIIDSEHQKALLFALRPYRDCHNLSSLLRLLENRDYGFFRHYDSSWKDGLCFFYAGTQVFPLLAMQSEMENFPAWIGRYGVKYPFGAYVRGRLREAVLRKSHSKGDTFSYEYALWANLC
jgi:hypothetical protein